MLILAATVLSVVTTLCDTEIVHVTPSYDARRIGDCGESKSQNALWHLDRLDSIDGHLDGRYAPAPVDAIVYVIDTGVEIDHDELADGNVIAGIDASPPYARDKCGTGNEALHPCMTTKDPALIGVYSHGTAVASLAGGRRTGVAPGVKIVSVRMAPGTFEDTFFAALDAIIAFAWSPSSPQYKTSIVSISDQLGPVESNTDVVTHAMIEAKIRDMTLGVDADGNRDPNGKRFFFSVAAGNDGRCSLFPATLGPSIAGLATVGGITRENKLWPGSCHGSAVELFAPAEDVLVAVNTGRDHYRAMETSGTSWSAPIVAGIAARILTTSPDLTPAELEARLEATPSSIADAPGPVVSVPSVPRRRAAAHQ